MRKAALRILSPEGSQEHTVQFEEGCVRQRVYTRIEPEAVFLLRPRQSRQAAVDGEVEMKPEAGERGPDHMGPQGHWLLFREMGSCWLVKRSKVTNVPLSLKGRGEQGDWLELIKVSLVLVIETE